MWKSCFSLGGEKTLGNLTYLIENKRPPFFLYFYFIILELNLILRTTCQKCVFMNSN